MIRLHQILGGIIPESREGIHLKIKENSTDLFNELKNKIDPEAFKVYYSLDGWENVNEFSKSFSVFDILSKYKDIPYISSPLNFIPLVSQLSCGINISIDDMESGESGYLYPNGINIKSNLLLCNLFKNVSELDIYDKLTTITGFSYYKVAEYLKQIFISYSEFIPKFGAEEDGQNLFIKEGCLSIFLVDNLHLRTNPQELDPINLPIDVRKELSKVLRESKIGTGNLCLSIHDDVYEDMLQYMKTYLNVGEDLFKNDPMFNTEIQENIKRIL